MLCALKDYNISHTGPGCLSVRKRSSHKRARGSRTGYGIKGQGSLRLPLSSNPADKALPAGFTRYGHAHRSTAAALTAQRHDLRHGQKPRLAALATGQFEPHACVQVAQLDLIEPTHQSSSAPRMRVKLGTSVYRWPKGGCDDSLPPNDGGGGCGNRGFSGYRIT